MWQGYLRIYPKALQQYPSAFALRDADLGQLSQTLIAILMGIKERRLQQG